MTDTAPTLTPPAPWRRVHDGTGAIPAFSLGQGEVSVMWWPDGIQGSTPYVNITGIVSEHEHIARLLAWLATGPVLPAYPRPAEERLPGGAS